MTQMGEETIDKCWQAIGGPGKDLMLDDMMKTYGVRTMDFEKEADWIIEQIQLLEDGIYNNYVYRFPPSAKRARAIVAHRPTTLVIVFSTFHEVDAHKWTIEKFRKFIVSELKKIDQSTKMDEKALKKEDREWCERWHSTR